MAKKKHSATAATTTTAETAPAAAAARDESPEKVERLKSLNHRLLKETVELREQVSQLLSRIDDLAIDHSFLSATEQDVAGVVLSSHVADLRSLAAARELELSAGRDAAEKEVRSLSEALKQADEKLNLAAREKEEIENCLDSVVSERDSIRKDADRKLMALIDFDSRACQWEIFVSVVDETLEQLRIIIGELLLLLESKEEALQVLVREKIAIEVKLEEQQQQVQVESLVAEKEVFEVKISALEERHRCVVGKNQQLQCEVHSLKEEAVNLVVKKDEAEHEKLLLMKFSSSLEKEKDSIQKALCLEKLVTSKLKSQVEELKKIEDVKEQELLDAKTNSQELSRELGLLQLALVEEQKKGSVWIWLYPVITTVLATISFAVATRSC